MGKLGKGITVVVVVAMVVAVVAPNFRRSRWGHGNEIGAIVTLRNLGRCQSVFQNPRRVDLDGDGIGEFGTLGEMTGNDGLRADTAGAKRGAPAESPVLSISLASVNEDGVATKSGYCFRVWLPESRGGAVHEGNGPTWGSGSRPAAGDGAPPRAVLPGSPFSGPVDVDATEARWCAYAWPVAFGNSGNHTFFIDQEGGVWGTLPADQKYQGTVAPVWDAAMPADGRSGWSPAPDAKEYRGRDGNLWMRAD